jgi:GNAT superfamily N-acetyltransferase
LPAIERSAANAFRGSSQAAVADDRVTPARWYRPLVPRGLIWVAVEDDRPFGFARTEPFEDALHLWELAVRLAAQRQGAGRALVMAVAADARARSLPAVTLTTFRDIPWNGPFYARLGFVEVPFAEANRRLAGLRAHEATLGLDVANRCAMRLAL